MRIFPILVAIAVSVAIFVFVFERDRYFAPDAPLQAAQGEATNAADRNAKTRAAVGVVAVHSVARTIDNAIVLRGQTEADRQVELKAETSGQVVSKPLRKGAFVKTGQMLCELDPATRSSDLAEAEARLAESKVRVPEAAARLEEALAQLTEAMINNNAAEKLSQDGFASEVRLSSTRAAVSSAQASVEAARSGLEAARTGIQSAEAAMAAAHEEINRLVITATFDGLLESDTAELGSLLQPGDVCATVIQLDPIILVGFVPETEVKKVAIGAAARAELASGDVAEGNVVFLSRSADQTTRTFRVEIEVPNAELTLRDGQTAEIVIASDGAMAHLLPQSALTLDDGGTLGVRIVTEQAKAKFVPVTLLRDTVNGVWLSGLADRADVIIIGQEYVTDGVMVAASYQEIGQ